MQEKETPLNLLEYGYSPDQVVNIEVKGHQVLGLLQVLDAIVKDNTHDIFLNGYQSEANPNYVDFEGQKKLDNVSVTWEPYTTPNAFFSQTPTEGLTLLGAHALDLLGVIQRVHKGLIDEGVAKKQTPDL